MLLGDDDNQLFGLFRQIIKVRNSKLNDLIPIVDRINREPYFIQLLKYDHDYSRLNPIYYQHANVFLITFCIDVGFERIRSIWFPQLHHYIGEFKFILLGMNKHLRAENNNLISQEFITNQSIKWNAFKYFELSLKDENDLLINSLMEDILSCHLSNLVHPIINEKKKKKCVLN